MSLRAHLGVEFFVNLFPLIGRKILSVVAALVSIIFFIMMIIYGFELVNSAMRQTSPVLQLPMGIVYLVIPISGIFLIMNLLFTTIIDVLQGEEEHHDDPVI
ncbi:Tripartite ATP-independent transporter, DctQ component [Thalassobacillus cyri]|uniref:Tripartite ATP-independent transporter, DctQ component n=2 Tax=Thalassobacillus cyri TaxID=571932 RepID=A0A1H4E3R5_9BACI|nr:Tripartite ATP-independent transporter, DctQ component [Thalassobacillus cyri]